MQSQINIIETKNERINLSKDFSQINQYFSEVAISQKIVGALNIGTDNQVSEQVIINAIDSTNFQDFALNIQNQNGN